jgi:hypothetical protein
MKNPTKWRQLGKLFISYLIICLPMAWLEAYYWADEPRSAGYIIGKGIFMAVLFTLIFGLLFQSGAGATFAKEKKQ